MEKGNLDSAVFISYKLKMDHITIRVSDIKKSKSFYLAALQPLDYKVHKEIDLGEVTLLGLKAPDQIGFWMTTDQPRTSFVHLAWKAQSKEQVDDFYSKALMFGGKCNGKPGSREYKPASYYAAYVFDPDGNNIEFVFGND